MSRPSSGLYDPTFEHDSCGLSFIAHIKGVASHSIVERALHAIDQLEHRGATNAEVNTGDGAGILVQVPHRFCQSVEPALGEAGSYGTGILFLPQNDSEAKAEMERFSRLAAEEALVVLSWRKLPVAPEGLGNQALDAMPTMMQVFVTADEAVTGLALDRKLYMLRKRFEKQASADTYVCSLSCRTMVYKGMLTTGQLTRFFPDLNDEKFESALAIVHSRFSTNTFPSWPLAHPYRFVAHNGEINTVRGNRNWMRAREAMLASDVWGDRIEELFPICAPGASDTASLDEALELLVLGGYELPRAVLMMIPEAWERNKRLDPDIRDFYRFHSSLMEPWDGPASVAFTDGTLIGAVLDRNGLRPGRYWVTSDDIVILASEVGVLEADPADIVSKGRLEPGKMLLVDTEAGLIVSDRELKDSLAQAEPYGKWLNQVIELSDLTKRHVPPPVHGDIVPLLVSNGYTEEEFEWLVEPMVLSGQEAIGSMGTDTPLAVLSKRPRLLFDYFSQQFSQVTNPPLDSIREELVTSYESVLGAEANLLKPGPGSCRQLRLPYPIITRDEMTDIIGANDDGDLPYLKSVVISGLYPIADGVEGLRAALDQMRRSVTEAIDDGVTVIVLSNRGATAELAPIPSLLMTGAVHHHMVREKTRTKAGLVIEAADAREVHHFALLIGYGARAICPTLAMDAIIDRIAWDRSAADPATAETNYLRAATKGVVKVMSKMGISTIASYTGAQIFEAIGLSSEFVDEFFTGTSSKVEGLGLSQLHDDIARSHQRAFPTRPTSIAHRELRLGGEYQWRSDGELHLFNPKSVFKLQHSTRTGQYEVFKEYTDLVNDQSRRQATLRSMFAIGNDRAPIPIDEVEPVSEIVKRFATGAMSYGSISAEAHETLAIAMNRIGGKSNSGEGGERSERYQPLANGDSKRSAIKQVASGRFGVTSYYLSNADDLQIKMAQGAKPGEGGHLPGKKVYPWIAETRLSTPGVGLISPPPHHDIYSIEDLAQLIHDLKNANPEARVHVKLVAEAGVGTVAAGCSKAKADVVLISGHDGGTGAAPLTSLKHAGGPWELGLAETQQTLLINDLRERVVVQVDGQLKTGRDVMIAALLGGEEFGFATAPLVVSGCILMRVCHLDTCPVGIATQNPELRNRYSGQPEFIENFFYYIAEEVREFLSELGYSTMAEAIGQVSNLSIDDEMLTGKTANLDLSTILYDPPLAPEAKRFNTTVQDHGMAGSVDSHLIVELAESINDGVPVRIRRPLSNTNRSVGTLLGHHVTKANGAQGLPTDTIQIDFVGQAGNSFGAFLPAGVTLRLTGDANDYVGKGLSGGRLAVFPSPNARFVAAENIVAGNVLLYGATSGEAYFSGIVGERFCVRNSGAEAVAEGVGDHGCEYMTGGRVVVLGPTGRNFGAGMSGGEAYVYDPHRTFGQRVNLEMVSLEKPSESDEAELLRLVTNHFAETGSKQAKRILGEWHSEKSLFVKVMPRELARVLLAVSEASIDDTDPTETIMEAAHG